MFHAGDIVKVLIPNVVNNGYDYRLPADAAIGNFVAVSVMRRPYIGVIIGSGDSGMAADKIKTASQVFDCGLSMCDLQWIFQMADWTLMSRGAVLRLILNVPDAFLPPKTEQTYAFNFDSRIRMTASRQAVADAFASNDNDAMSAHDIQNIARVSGAVIRTLIQNGTLVPVAARAIEDNHFAYQYSDMGNICLNPEQAAAAAAISDAVAHGEFSVHLLDGITGSGKTQVYFDAALRAYQAGRSVLLMMPEIALTAQFMDRFAARFGAPPVVWHSNLTAARRREIWRGVLRGDIRMVVGTRSALFLPWQNLGLIVVDEEHDTSYKQDDMGNYHARDMAVLRAKIAGFPVVLASATPSAETLANVAAGRYGHLRLRSRFGGANLPTIDTIDMRVNRPTPYTVLSEPHPASPDEPALRPAPKGRVSGHGFTRKTLSQAQDLRKNCTDAECLFWYHLGKYPHHYGFSRQRPIGNYIVDFVNFEHKVIIEIDGAQHGNENHRNHDAKRDAFLRDAGYVVLRFWNDEIFKDINAIFDAINAYIPSYPPLEGGSAQENCAGVGLENAADSGNQQPGCLSDIMCAEIARTIESGQQVMLFINRRGYAPIIQCKKCGWVAGCPDCSTSMTYHKRTGKMMCHMCGRVAPMPQTCPDCGDVPGMRGAGLERIEEEVQARFPGVRTALVSSDTILSRQALERLVHRMESGEIDIVIGTQILAKGHHFPNLTLVGVVDADMGLFGTDFRAGEHTFQQLFQVAGRAGRGQLPGRVLLQTYQPEHPVIRALCAGDRDSFMNTDMEMRRMAKMPPYGQLIALIVEGARESVLQKYCADLAAAAPIAAGVKIMGPVPAQIYQVRNWFRMRFLVAGDARARMQPIVSHWVAKVRVPANIRVKIDVGPQNFS